MKHLYYTGGTLDRAAIHRKDENWLNQRLALKDTLILPIHNGRNLIGETQEGAPEPILLTNSPVLRDGASELIFLGLDQEQAIFLADLSPMDEADVMAMAPGGAFQELRKSGPQMTPPQGSLLAYARGLHYWSLNHVYCSRCGSKTLAGQGGHMRLCPKEGCARECYPRTDPAVIMLVEYRPEDGSQPLCLLGARNKDSGKYSTLAGFVEPGESLEEAVVREVWEEAGVHVKDIHYQASQPWPFPCSIMLGFTALAESMDVNLGDDELDDARWFTAEELRTAGEWGDPEAEIKLSPKDSIARSLINAWLEKVEQVQFC